MNYYVQDGNNVFFFFFFFFVCFFFFLFFFFFFLTNRYESHTPCAVNSVYIISPANAKSLFKIGFGHTIFNLKPLVPLWV